MGKYTDGEYKVEGLYGGGKKSIIVKLKLDNDAIKDLEVTPNTPEIKMSFNLQKRFAEAAPDEVNGKSIDEVHLDKLAGSSQTTKGFNDALEKIKTKATK